MDYYEGLQRLLIGKPERIYTEFRDANRNLVNPSGPSVTIYDPSGVQFASAVPVNESVGTYYHVVVSTAGSPEGMFSAYWSGTINGALITMDVPQYFWLTNQPWELAKPDDLIQSIRRFIGDTNPNNYRIATQDIHYFLRDAVNEVQTIYNMGYTITVTPTSVTFNKTVTQTPETLFKIKTAELIMSSVMTDVLFTGVNLSLGDVKVNFSDTIKLRQEYIKQLRTKFDELLKDIKRNTAAYSGILINNYLLENQVNYNLNYLS